MSAPLNPYVGAVPLGKENPIFGRDREIRELQYLLTAERVVLLYSPSGAGKSSLVRAKNGVANRLRENFDVWPVARVQDEPPAGARNRYIWSAARYWESELPEARRRSDEALGQLSLQEIVKKRPRRKDAPASTLLIFDQFEELVRLNPVDLDAKREFFEELGELLSDPSIWALFVLREDYLAAFDPYARCVPTHFRHRFRLDLLTVEAAKLAIAKPAIGERQWHPDAVDRLVDELSQVRVQPLEGASYKVPGAYVEPMHLQVVCQEIWRTMPADDNMVDVKDLGDFGDVDKVLGRYYESAIGEGRPFAEARAMRNWMGTRLITTGQVRGQVMRRPKESDGLRNDLIEELVSMHLVRAEQRGGSVWFELAHDRLIEPVLADNRQWFAANLSELERRAELWEENGKSRDLLASGLAYWRMRQWKGRNPERCGPVETEFLAESWSKVTGSFWRWGTTAAAVVAAFAAWVAMREAERLQEVAERQTKALVTSEGDLKATLEELKTKSGELTGQLERNQGLLKDLRATAQKERLAREESQKELGMRLEAEKQSVKARKEERYRIAEMFDERAEAALRRRDPGEAWIYTLAALKEEWEKPDFLPQTLGRLMLGDLPLDVNPPDKRLRRTLRASDLLPDDPTAATEIAAIHVTAPDAVQWISRLRGVSTIRCLVERIEGARRTNPRACRLEQADFQVKVPFQIEILGFFAPDGSPLVTTTAGAKWWPIRDQRVIAVAAGQRQFAALTRKTNDETIRIHDRTGGKLLREYSLGFQSNATALAISGWDDSLIASGGQYGRVELFRGEESLRPVANVLIPGGVPIRSLVLVRREPNGLLLAAGTSDGRVFLLEQTDRNKEMRILASVRSHRGGVTAMAADTTGDSFLSGGEDGSIRTYYLRYWQGDTEIPVLETLRSPGAPALRRVYAKTLNYTLTAQNLWLDHIQVKSKPTRGSGFDSLYYDSLPESVSYIMEAGVFEKEADGQWRWEQSGWHRLRERAPEATKDGYLYLDDPAARYSIRFPRHSSEYPAYWQLKESGSEIWVSLGRILVGGEGRQRLAYENLNFERVTLEPESWRIERRVTPLTPYRLFRDAPLSRDGIVLSAPERGISFQWPAKGGSAAFFGKAGSKGVQIGKVTLKIPGFDPDREFTYHAGRVEFRNIRLNRQSPRTTVAPGSRVALSLEWGTRPSRSLPGQPQQLFIGMIGDEAQGFSRCLLSRPMERAEQGYISISVTAPRTPGTYYITHDFSVVEQNPGDDDIEVPCDAKPSPLRHRNDPEKAIAVIRVATK